MSGFDEHENEQYRNAQNKYVVQHEFDDEPTYIVHRDNDTLAVEISPAFPQEKRRELARVIADWLNANIPN